jgi:hypothetical protein
MAAAANATTIRIGGPHLHRRELILEFIFKCLYNPGVLRGRGAASDLRGASILDFLAILIDIGLSIERPIADEACFSEGRNVAPSLLRHCCARQPSRLTVAAQLCAVNGLEAWAAQLAGGDVIPFRRRSIRAKAGKREAPSVSQKIEAHPRLWSVVVFHGKDRRRVGL